MTVPMGLVSAKPSLSGLVATCYPLTVKISDDYRAKVRLWAMRPAVVALPPGPTLPGFTAQKFQTHVELNQWKKSRLRKLAQSMASHG
jgi:hypothetical protein